MIFLKFRPFWVFFSNNQFKATIFCLLACPLTVFGDPVVVEAPVLPELVVSEVEKTQPSMSFESIFSNLDTFLSKEIRDQLEFQALLAGTVKTEKTDDEINRKVTLIRSGHQRLYQILSKVDGQFDQGEFAVKLEPESFEHLRVFSGDHESLERNIWTKFDRTKSCFGRAVLAKIFATPTTDTQLLKSRQLLLSNLVIDHDFFNQFDSYFDKIKAVQDDLIEVLGTNPENDSESLLHKSYNLYFNRIFDFDKKNRYGILNDLKKKCLILNKNSAVCNANLGGLFFLKFIFLVSDYFSFKTSWSYLLRRDGNVFNKGFVEDIQDWWQKLSGGTLGAGLQESFYGDTSLIPTKLSPLLNIVRNPVAIGFGTREWAIAIKKSLRQSGAMREVFQAYAEISHIVKSLDPEQRRALNLFEKSAEDLNLAINKDLDWLINNLQKTKNPGAYLKAYKLIYDLRSNMAYVFASLGQLDAYLSMARLFQELFEKKNGLCFTEFVQSPHPIIKIESSWDLSLDPDVAVPSDIELGGNGDFHNAILTGPNTGGKSTFMRSPFLNILFSQTFGVGCGQRVILTIMHGIFSYMNVVGNVSKGMSQYYAEAHTVATAFNKIQKLADEGKFSFFIVDEMFSGTNPGDARSILESICHEVVGLPNTVWIISTHLPGAARSIVEVTKGRFGGLMIKFSKNADGVLASEHKVIKGISTQSTAFDVAISAGLNKKMIENARKIRESLGVV